MNTTILPFQGAYRTRNFAAARRSSLLHNVAQPERLFARACERRQEKGKTGDPHAAQG